MPDFYAYLVSSLPMLYFEGKPPFSFGSFLNKCKGFIPDKDLAALSALSEEGFKRQKSRVIKKISDFDALLRNELVKLRAARKRIAPEKYLRPDGYAGPAIYHVAQAAQRNPSPLEAERTLDRARWNFLDELCFGHYFDLDFLIIYGLKLLILERWEKIEKADKEALLDNLIASD